VMDEEKLNIMVEDLYTLFPLFRKKIFRPRKQFKQNKIPYSHYHVLGILRKRGELPMSEIGRLAHIHKSNMTALTDKLVEEGVAERLPDKNDRRKINLAINNQGKELLDHWRKQHYTDIKTKLATLSKEDQETLYQSVKNIKEIIQKIDKE
jgi:DNA-binding MarR family transcriptional regulator